MIVTRAAVAKIITGFFGLNIFDSSLLNDKHNCISPENQYHTPPPGVTYETNPTNFGRILEGKIPHCTIFETDELLCFRDRTPRASLHGLVIPKKYIESVDDLTEDDLDLLQKMKEVALETIRTEQPDAYANNDYRLCFHVPPFISVGHLHLHVLGPVSEMKVQHRFGKYLVGTRWCMDLDKLIQNMSNRNQVMS